MRGNQGTSKIARLFSGGVVGFFKMLIYCVVNPALASCVVVPPSPMESCAFKKTSALPENKIANF